MGESGAITIRRQVLDVAIRATEAEGLAFQRRLPGICADVLLPAIESALAPYDPGDVHLGIDRLEIEVSVHPDRLEVELAEGIRREVAAWFRAHPSAREGSAPATSEGEVRRSTTAQTVDDALVSFLGSGRLSWSFDVPAGTSLEDMIMESWGASGQPPSPSSRMRDRLVAVLGTQAQTRLVLQFSAPFRAVVLRAIAPGTATAAEEVSSVLARVPTREAAPAAIDALLRELEQVSLAAAVAGGQPDASALVAQAWARLSARTPSPGTPDLRALAEVIRRHWPGDGATIRVPEQPTLPAPATDPGRTGPPTARESTTFPDLDQGTPVGEAGLTRRATAGPRFPLDDLDDGILVDSAGLVLLHPFLPRFLEGLGLARGEQLLDPHRAVGVLHHLATGERTAPEHRVTLAKVLCGLALDEPVPLEIGAGDEVASYASEATALLEAVVGHWTALRDTSPDALRGEFLTRPGLVSVTDDGDWLLRVESRTVDILLADLPWGFSMFRLPWMSALMQVEWR